MNTPNRKTSRGSEFSRLAKKRRGFFVGEYLFLMKTNKKYWMLPLLLILLALGALIFISSSALAPLIYTLF